MLQNSIFVAICFVLDFVLMAIFPYEYSGMRMCFIPAMGLTSLVFFSKQMSLIDSILFSFFVGLLYGFFLSETYLFYAILFALIAFLTNVWAKHMTNTLIEVVLLSLAVIFVKELAVFGWMTYTDVTQMTFVNWMYKILFITVIGNVLPILFIVFLNEWKQDFEIQKERQLRSEEKIKWQRFKN